MTFVEFIQRTDAFIFDYRVDPTIPALMRILCAVVIMVSFWQRRHDTLTFLDPNGIFGDAQYDRVRQHAVQLDFLMFLPRIASSPRAIMAGLFLSGLFTVLGISTSISIVVFLLYVVSVQSRTFLIMFSGGDSISRTLLLCLACTNTGATLSIDSWWSQSDAGEIAGWPIRLLQIYLCCIYFWNAIHKFQCEFWMRGVAVRNATHSGIWSRRWMLNVFRQLWVSRLLTYSTLVFEFFGPLLIWFKDLRIPIVLIGMSLHLGITVMLRIGYFGPMMMVALLSFCVW